MRTGMRSAYCLHFCRTLAKELYNYLKSIVQLKFTFYMCLSVPSPQKEGIRIGTHSRGHQGSKCPHLHHAPCSPLPTERKHLRNNAITNVYPLSKFFLAMKPKQLTWNQGNYFQRNPYPSLEEGNQGFHTWSSSGWMCELPNQSLQSWVHPDEKKNP